MSPVWRQAVVLALGQAEVGDPDDARGVEQQVRRLDVAVDDAAGMGVGQPLRRLAADLRHAPEEGEPGGPRAATVETWLPPGSTAEGPGAVVGPGPAGSGSVSTKSAVRVASRAEPLGRGRAGRGGRQDVTGRDRPFGREPAAQERLRDPAERGLPQAGRRSGRGRPGAVRPSRLPLEAAQPRQLVDDLVEPLALDELHRVVGRPRRRGRPRRPARCWCGAAAPPPSPRGGTAPAPCGRRATWPGRTFSATRRPRRDLLGLVDHPHPAPADLAEDPVVAQPPLLARSADRRRAAPLEPGSGSTDRSCSTITRAGSSSRICSASSGWRAAYSSMLGRSPARNRARNDSATTSKGSRSEVGSLMITSPSTPPRQGRPGSPRAAPAPGCTACSPPTSPGPGPRRRRRWSSARSGAGPGSRGRAGPCG